MSIDQLKDQIPDFAKDVRLNLASMRADETLSPQSKHGLLLSSAIAARNPVVTAAMESAAGVVMTPAAVEAATRIQDDARSAAHELAWQFPVWTEPISSCGHWQ